MVLLPAAILRFTAPTTDCLTLTGLFVCGGVPSGVYKVTVDAAQHKVIVTGNVEADALVRRLHKAGKQAVLWPSPSLAPAPVEAMKPEEAAPSALPVAAGESGGKPKEAKDKPPENGAGKEKKPAKDKGSDKKADNGEAAKPNKDEASKDAEAIPEPKETKKCSPEPAKQDAAEEAGAEEPGGGGGKKGKKNKKNKPKDGGEGEAPAPAPAAPEKKPHQPPVPAPSPGPERPPHSAFPYYAAQPMLSYNVAHPSSSVSYHAPTPGVPMHPMPPPPPQVVPYGYPPYYPPLVPVPAEFLYGPPGMRSSPPQESYNMFNEDNANSCSLM